MAVVRVPRLHSSRRLRKDVMDAMMIVGEPCIILQMFHPVEDKDAPRCKHCYDDVYKDTRSVDCDYCFGTTFEGGIKRAVLTYGIFGSSNESKEDPSRRGWADRTTRPFECSSTPPLKDYDHVVRLFRQSELGLPQDWEYYTITRVDRDSLRDGMRPNSLSNPDRASDLVSQSGQIVEVNPGHPIRKFSDRELVLNYDLSFPMLEQLSRELL